MDQLTQKLKNGKMQVSEVPLPSLHQGHVLVRNHYSLISSGTEISTVKTARKGYISKARERPQQFKQVIDTLKTQGPTQTFRAVMKKLDAYSTLGYSCAGVVIDVSKELKDFRVGDYVACGGLSASHSEIVSIPSNLCVKLKADVDLKQAAYNTLGAIALQGVRQADLRIGETCAVIGLGLIGQLTALLLRASGIRVVGIDINPLMVDIAKNNCLDISFIRNDPGIEKKIHQFSDGLGCDAVIITAASHSLDPINFAGAISRKKGTIVIVGAVPTGFDREPHFYKKELQVKMSCSYGPGRYDPIYEEKGYDYPPAFVRWTEQRNMQAFQELIYRKIIDLSYLTTHTFKLEDAPLAYDMMLNGSEPSIGILIEYDITKKLDRLPIFVEKSAPDRLPATVSIGFIGAGSYAQSYLLPNISKNNNVRLNGVMTATSTSSRSVAERYQFDFFTSNENDILKNEEINTIFIATRHDSHADYIMKALKAGKHVFVEKPLCLTEIQLFQISDQLNSLSADISPSAPKSQVSDPILMVGYNRRFSPLLENIKEVFDKGPTAMMYRVNAGSIPAESWIQDPDFGGGRIIGEICHFVDTLIFLADSLVVSVYATAICDADNLNDTLNISLTFENGSIGSISYFANGDKNLPKERLEVFAHGVCAIVDDFKELTVYSNGKRSKKKLVSQDKGQKNEIKRFIGAIAEGKGFDKLIRFEELYNTSLVTLKIIESIRTGECIKL